MDLSNSAPGFDNLGLDAGYTAYPSRVETKKSFLQAALRQESPIVHKAIELLQNEMYNHLPRRENDVLRGLQDILNRDSKHLNTLAQLEFFYRQKGNTDRARDIQDIRTSDSHEDKQKGIYLLEQAYALLFEERTDTECSAYQKLYDACTILKHQNPRSENENRALQEALSCTNEALRSTSSLPKQSNDHVDFEKLELCILKFKTGISILQNIEWSESEIVTWSFYLAMAMNRKAESIFYPTGREIKEKEMNGSYLEAIDCFWSVINKLPSDNTDFKLYRARSYAYIGHILAAKENLLEIVHRKYQDDEHFHDLLNDIRRAAKKAEDLLSTDETVLDRCGRIFRLMATKEKNKDNKLKDLKEAERLLSRSIELKPQKRQRTYSPRMQVYSDLAGIDQNKKEYLLKARDDGLRCLENNITRKNLVLLAMVCQRLAKFPKGTWFGQEFVVDREYLHEAVDHLTFGIRAFGLEYNLSYAMGSCMFDLGELRKAIEWYKISFFFDTHNSFNSYKHAYIVLLQLYRTIIEQNLDAVDLLDELLTVLEMQTEFASLDNFKDTIFTPIYKRYKQELIDFHSYLCIKQKTSKQESIANFVRDILIEESHGMLMNRMTNYMEDRTCTLSQLNEFQTEEALKNTSPTGILYDYFLLYIEDDAKWLQSFLVYQLEQKLYDDDIPKKLCFGVRYFNPGDTIEMSTVKAISSSHKTLLVLTNAFLLRLWPNIKTCIVKMFADKLDCLVIILLEQCEIPEEFNNVTCLDFTVRNMIPHEIQKLKLS